jgi:hypothetical protein
LRKGIGRRPKSGTKGCYWYQKKGTRGQSALDADGEKNNSTIINNNNNSNEIEIESINDHGNDNDDAPAPVY